MQIDKAQIIEFLKSQGEGDKAGQAESELPEQVDTDKDAGLLEKLGNAEPLQSLVMKHG